MEASVRIFNSSNSILLKLPSHSRILFPPMRSSHIPRCTIQTQPYCYTRIRSSFPHSSLSNAVGFLQSLAASHAFTPSTPTDHSARIVSHSKNNPFQWNYAFDGVNGEDRGIGDNYKKPIVTVVLLGWLGSKPKHLRRYVELYNSKGIHAITFVAPVKDVLSIDLGRRVQRRISDLAVELASWLSETERDGRQRFLLFHTFSNTGWLAYGAILDNLRGRQDLLEKIKGCVFDSGADPNINPKVWAAGFAAALLKKHSFAAYSSAEMGEKKPLFVEVVLLLALENLFSFLLNLPDINQRLSRIISILSRNQPPCPQLYIYSTADKVIPFQSVESFIEEQRRMGREVWSFNFESSPHVDHYRTFPTEYSSQLHDFLSTCLSTVKQI